VYDNSDNNPHNPTHPAVHVTYGEETRNEMAVLFLSVALPTPADVPPFQQSMRMQYLESFLAEGNGIGDLPPGLPAAQVEKVQTHVFSSSTRTATANWMRRNVRRCSSFCVGFGNKGS